MSEPCEVVERLRRCIREDDRSSVAELLAIDGVVEWPFAVPGAPRRLEGRDAFRDFLARSASASALRLDDLRVLAVHETADPEVIVIETATCGTVAATGRRFELPAIAVLRVRGG